MELTNTNLVRYSEFHVGGYPTIFSRIYFANGKLQYNGFLQDNAMVSDVSPLSYLGKRVLVFVSGLWYNFVQQGISLLGSNFQFFI